ncbi:MAG TPA: Clp protease N-terminal domain-containing protein, partial [Aggregatilineales bacterium]|nr:Clp protease N-terminal domain-containing protein [Aggregatilineales bacterium]
MPNKMERFSQRARRVLSLAQEEAERLQHSYIGTEHLLLGLIREDGGVAARVLRELGVEQRRVEDLVERMTRAGGRTANRQLDLSPGAKKILVLAVDEARRMGHHYIGTEHLLLGLVRQTDGVAIDVLKRLNVSPEEVRRQVRRLLTESLVKPPSVAEVTEESDLGKFGLSVQHIIGRPAIDLLNQVTGDESVVALARLIFEEAKKHVHNQEATAHHLRLKALDLLLLLYEREGRPAAPAYKQDVDLLCDFLGEYDLPGATYRALLTFYEKTGQFSRAEDILFFWLQADRPDHLLVVEAGTALVQRLQQLPESVLRAGGLALEDLDRILQDLHALGKSRVDLAQTLAARYSALEPVEAVALGGSLASGVADKDSDIDLYVFLRADLPPQDRARIVSETTTPAAIDNSFWGPGDEWRDAETGIHVDVIFWSVA